MRTRQQNRSATGISDLRAVSEVFADCTDQQDDKLVHVTQQLEELKTLVKAGRAESAQPVEAHTGSCCWLSATLVPPKQLRG